MNKQITVSEEECRDGLQGRDHDLSLALVRDNARRSLVRTRDRMTAPGADGRQIPLPVPGIAEVTIGQAFEAAFLHLETLKRDADLATEGDVNPLDWSEDLLEAVDLTHLSRARR